MPKIVPCLWFDDEAEEAAELYTSLFPDSKVLSVARYPANSPRPEGMVMTVNFVIAGQEYMGLNGGPEFPFTEAVSLHVTCETQEEVDRLWDSLTADGGEESMCGWLKDKYGLSWQVEPRILGEMLQDNDREKADRVMQAMLQMKKIDSAALQRAYDGR